MSEPVEAYSFLLSRTLARPDLLDVICAHVASGGSLIDWCDTAGIRYGDISNWLHKDRERSNRVNLAFADRTEWDREVVMAELRRIGLTDIRKAFDQNGKLLDMDQMPTDVARAIASIEVDELFEGHGQDREQVGYTRKIKFWDKLSALEKIGKQAGMFIQKHQVTVTKTLEDLVEDSKGEADGDGATKAGSTDK